MRIVPAANYPGGPSTGGTVVRTPTYPRSADSIPRIVLDFDGTVCLGDGPIWAYAEAVAQALPADRAARLREGLTAYLAGESADGNHVDAAGRSAAAKIRGRRDHPEGAAVDPAQRYPDGYAAVVALAGPDLPPGALQRAYLASRRQLADGSVDVHAPVGFAALMAEMGGSVHRVLLTNAPDVDLAVVLTRLGLHYSFDEVVTSAGKPDGFAALLPALLGDAPPAALMSVGDVWVNDIEPPLEAGCATALVDRSGCETRPAHARAASLPELFPVLRRWAADPSAFLQSHHRESDVFQQS